MNKQAKNFLDIITAHGELSLPQLQAMSGVSRPTAYKHINALIASGAVDARVESVMDNGRLKRATMYRPKVASAEGVGIQSTNSADIIDGAVDLAERAIEQAIVTALRPKMGSIIGRAVSKLVSGAVHGIEAQPPVEPGVTGGGPVAEDAADGAAQPPVAAPAPDDGRDKLPNFVVVGLEGGEPAIIGNEFRKDARIRFFSSSQSISNVYRMKGADRVFLFVRNLGHSVQKSIESRGVPREKMIVVHGGLTQLREAIHLTITEHY